MNRKQLAQIAKSNGLVVDTITRGATEQCHCGQPGAWDIYLESTIDSNEYTATVQVNFPKCHDGWEAERDAAIERVAAMIPAPAQIARIS